MNSGELQQAISKTLEENQWIKEEIEKATDPREEKKLLAKLKELQYLQLWHIGQQDRC